jgi:proteic killer suppression protein
MIQSFADSEAELIWSGRRSRKLPADIQNVALRKLRLLNQARVLGDLRVPPGNRLEALRADRQGAAFDPHQRPMAYLLYMDEGGPSHVEIIDYHV